MKHRLGALIGVANDQDLLSSPIGPVPDSIEPPNVTDYRMDGNDKLGDCVAESTVVEGAEALQGYRAPYSGPVVTLRFASGKELTVTPNHAILTPRGFVRARFLNKGDKAVSGHGLQHILASAPDYKDFYQAPALIEDIVASFQRGRNVMAQGTQSRNMVSSIDFHGDERFIDGDIEIKSSERLLESEVRYSSLGYPSSQQEIRDSGELESPLHRLSSALEGSRGRRSSPLGLVGILGQSDPLVGGHSGITQSYGGSHVAFLKSRFLEQLNKSRSMHPSFVGQLDISFTSSVALKERQKRVTEFDLAQGRQPLSRTRHLVASASQPTLQGDTTDPQLASYLLEGFPGFIATDEIVDVDLHWYRGHVYDLSTSTRWYTANSIVAHNCTIAGADHCTAAWNVIYKLDLPRLSETQLEHTYFRLGHNQDVGLPEQTVVSAWKRESAPAWFGYQLSGGQMVANAAIRHVIAAHGLAYLGVALPSVAEDQFEHGEPWSVVPGASIAGGHCVVAVGYDPEYLTVITWGKAQKVTWDWWASYGFETWSLTPPQIHKV